MTKGSQAMNFSRQLTAEGYAVIPPVMEAARVEKLKAQIANALETSESSSPHAIRHLARAVPAVMELAVGKDARSLWEPVLGPGAFLVRSLFFDKSPGANWRVPWHQDLTIAVTERIEVPGFRGWSMKEAVHHVQPPAEVLEQMLTLRFHLDDCGPEDGPLLVIPGSHQSGRLRAEQISAWRTRREPKACHIAQGGALLMRPLLLHSSAAAARPLHRRVIHLEFAAQDLPGGLNWLR